MTEEIFNNRKSDLEQFLLSEMDRSGEKQKIDIQTILEILKKYNFYNRSKMKGLLARTVVDSLELNYTIGSRIIEFDNSVS